ncbi:MAG: wax ester/triacylglycerol synthase family O-acyltransferase [Thermoleophilaceae bacterium]
MASRTRLTPLDASFLRLETPTAHMHVAWSGVFHPPAAGRRPTLAALRRSVDSRLRHLARFRQRLAFPPLGLGEPYWVDDESFEVARHVTSLAGARDRVSPARFAELCDGVLSVPLDRSRPLWQVYLVPRLDDDRVGLLVKLHHAMVDGKSAVELGLLLFDLTPDAVPVEPEAWEPEARPGPTRLALDALADGAADSLRDVRSAARLASPRGGGRIADTLRRTALAVGEDLLRPAPSSHVNVPIGPRRTLAGYRAPIEELNAVRRAAPGATLNDACLAVVAGGMRDLVLRAGRIPQPLKAMVPVSVRGHEERSALGNRISFAFVDLPVNVRSPRRRLQLVHERTAAFKRSGRTAGTEAVLGAVGRLPAPVKTRAARIAGSSRVYNLTVSNVPGPRVPVYMLGAELAEAYPVVPLSDEHALSVGIFTYRDHAHFGCYADPDALPGVGLLPDALCASLLALRGSWRVAARPSQPVLRSLSSTHPSALRSSSA